jgi:yersiniabactin nonribosomal peptide synthetase
VDIDPVEPNDPLPASERALMAIERAIRGVIGRSIGKDENFFDAGLTSLALVQLHQVSTRELADPFPVTVMFAYPNLRALRRYLIEGESVAPTVVNPAVDGGRLRRIGNARRELRKRIRSESERP